MPKLKEDAPVNAVGGGNIAGLGVGDQGEPGIPKKRQRKLVMLRRKTPGQKLEEEDGTHFAGHRVFTVPTHDFLTARYEKRKGKHWKTYISSEGHGAAIREYANANYNKPIIIKDERTGAMCFARYGKK